MKDPQIFAIVLGADSPNLDLVKGDTVVFKVSDQFTFGELVLVKSDLGPVVVCFHSKLQQEILGKVVQVNRSVWRRPHKLILREFGNTQTESTRIPSLAS